GRMHCIACQRKYRGNVSLKLPEEIIVSYLSRLFDRCPLSTQSGHSDIGRIMNKERKSEVGTDRLSEMRREFVVRSAGGLL
ncbi:MAG: hypothetical protein V3T45_05060, partial [Nitrospinaceae bacterium]